MRHLGLPLLFALSLAGCTREVASTARHYDSVLVRARALQALVCVQVQRVPPEWKSDISFRSAGSGEVSELLFDQPLMDHAKRISSVFSRETGKVYLVIQEGFPETILVYGPIPEAPRCDHGKAS